MVRRLPQRAHGPDVTPVEWQADLRFRAQNRRGTRTDLTTSDRAYHMITRATSAARVD